MAVNNIVDKLLALPFAEHSFKSQNEIKSRGRPTPLLNLVQHEGDRKRSFSHSWYDKYRWLTASESKQSLFCWPCLLFPTPLKNATSQGAWKKGGFSDMKNVHRFLLRHSMSQDHMVAEVRFKMFGRQFIDKSMHEHLQIQNEKHNANVTRNRLILRRLIDISTLVVHLEFNKATNTTDNNIFREYFNHLSKYDDILKSSHDFVFAGASKIEHSELMESIAYVLRQQIESEISETQFFSYEIDKTTDIEGKSQVSIIVRFLANGTVVERFLGFFDINSFCDATYLSTLLTRELGKFNYQKKLVAQTYDGAAVISSELHKLQENIKQAAPQASFIHCYAHQLELILSLGVRSIRDARLFFSTMNKLSSFLLKSAKRMDVLNSLPSQPTPTNTPMPLDVTSSAVIMVADTRDKLLREFQFIIESGHFDDGSVAEAILYTSSLENFQFVFLLFTFRNIFELVNNLDEILQSRSSDHKYFHTQTRIMSALEKVKELRSEVEFNAVYDEVADLVAEPVACQANNINCPETLSEAIPEVILEATQKGKSEARPETIHDTNPRDIMKATYYEVLDCIIEQLSVRFADFENIVFLPIVDIAQFECYAEAFPSHLFLKLKNTYGKYFNLTKLNNELIVLYSNKEFWESSKSALSLLSNLTANSLHDSLSEVIKLLQLVVTMPVLFASTDKSLACLKRVQQHAENTTQQERTAAFSLLSIESNLLSQMEKKAEFHDKVTDHFVSVKKRQSDFHFI